MPFWRKSVMSCAGDSEWALGYCAASGQCARNSAAQSMPPPEVTEMSGSLCCMLNASTPNSSK
eukprot:14974303-Heterocapsa_arctica.AAC.1